jgi:hypothetical protein
MFQRQGAIFRESKYKGMQVPTQQYWYYINKIKKLLIL